MARIERFEDIEAWKAARELANFAYDLTAKPRFARDFGLRDQIQRAAVSVMSNIGYITNDELDAGIRLAEKTSRLIAGFIAYLESVEG